MDGKQFALQKALKFSAVFFLVALLAPAAKAAVIELSALASYSHSNFGLGTDAYTSSEHRYSGSVEFKFTQVSGIQFEYLVTNSNSSYLTNVGGLIAYYTPDQISYQDTVYSINWVQNLAPSKWMVQPYAKIGGGRLIRKYVESYPELGSANILTQNQMTGVGGVGLRIFLTKNFALKGEFETYVPSFHFKSWKDDEQFSAGVSWVF